MTTYTTTKYNRALGTGLFLATRSKAILLGALQHLTHHHKPLADIRFLPGILNSQRSYLGNMEIHLSQITGCVNRRGDYDRQLRPLRMTAVDQWVNAYSRMNADHSEPVRLYKVGSNYYVKDGINQVSVAKSIGMKSIQAEVWEICPEQPYYAFQPSG